MIIVNKIVSILLLVFVFLLIRYASKKNSKNRLDILIEKIQLIGGAILIFIMAIGFFTTNKPFCELVPFLCR